MSLKTALKSLVANAKTKEALAKLLQIADIELDTSITNSIILLSGRFTRLTNEQNMGIISNEDAKIENAKINYALLSLIDELPEAVKPAASQEQTIAAANNIIVTGDNNIIVQGVSGSTIHINQK